MIKQLKKQNSNNGVLESIFVSNYGINNLVISANAILIIFIKKNDLTITKDLFENEIKLFEQKAKDFGYDQSACLYAKNILSACVDQTILDNKFFKKLDALQENFKQDIYELLYLCLSLEILKTKKNTNIANEIYEKIKKKDTTKKLLITSNTGEQASNNKMNTNNYSSSSSKIIDLKFIIPIASMLLIIGMYFLFRIF